MLIDHELYRRVTSCYLTEDDGVDPQSGTGNLNEVQPHCTLLLKNLRCPNYTLFSDGSHLRLRLTIGCDQKRDHGGHGKIDGIDTLVLAKQTFAKFQRNDLRIPH